MSESYYATLGFDLKPDETIYTIKMTDESKNDALEEKLQGILEAYPGYAFEGRVQELADEMQIQQGLRMIIYLFIHRNTDMHRPCQYLCLHIGTDTSTQRVLYSTLWCSFRCSRRILPYLP